MFNDLVSWVFGSQTLESHDTSDWKPPVITSVANSIFPSNLLNNV